MHRLLIVIVMFLFSCQPTQKEKEIFLSKADYEAKMIESHKAYLTKERIKIDAFVDSTGLDFKKTPTGLRYYTFPNGSMDSIKVGEVATINYVLTLINGDTAYSTIDSKPQQFIVEFDNVENGLHEGIQKLAVGDSAIFILPAHLGYGITGDQTVIPSQSVLVYYLRFLSKTE